MQISVGIDGGCSCYEPEANSLSIQPGGQSVEVNLVELLELEGHPLKEMIAQLDIDITDRQQKQAEIDHLKLQLDLVKYNAEAEIRRATQASIAEAESDLRKRVREFESRQQQARAEANKKMIAKNESLRKRIHHLEGIMRDRNESIAKDVEDVPM